MLRMLLISLMIGLTTAVSAVESFHPMGKQIRRTTFVKRERVNGQDIHQVVIAVKKNNMETLESMIIDRATPGNVLYQQWFTYDEITNLVKNENATKRVKEWLIESKAEITWVSNREDYIKAKAPFATWERLLSCEFYAFEDTSVTQHAGKRNPHIVHRALEYSIPARLRDDIHAIFYTVQTPPRYRPKYRMRNRKPSSWGTQQPYKSVFRLQTSSEIPENNKKIQTQSSGQVTVSFLNEYYQISSNIGDSRLNQSVFETGGETYSSNDLKQFQTTYGLTVQDAIDVGGYKVADCLDAQNCTEGNLDIQYIMGVAQKTASVYWYVTDQAESDPFVLWITELADARYPPQSNSISWGELEIYVDNSTVAAFNQEAQIAAGRGITIMVSSGDDGAPDIDPFGQCSCDFNQGYNPSFPASSPWVTAVGATMGPESDSEEIACQSQLGGVITSGGGFSSFSSRPSWQNATVEFYFGNLTDAQWPQDGYAVNGRGYPDVSLIGVEYQVMIGGALSSVFGTSASSPVFAAFVSLVNAHRLRQNLSSIGFINPTLYAVGYNNTIEAGNLYNASFNDITSGHNKCCAYSDADYATNSACCDTGFVTTEGWDPVTGWGSVDFPDFAAMFDVQVNYTSTDSSSSKHSNQETVIIIAVVVGVVGGAILVGIGVIWWCYQKRIRVAVM